MALFEMRGDGQGTRNTHQIQKTIVSHDSDSAVRRVRFGVHPYQIDASSPGIARFKNILRYGLDSCKGVVYGILQAVSIGATKPDSRSLD